MKGELQHDGRVRIVPESRLESYYLFSLMTRELRNAGETRIVRKATVYVGPDVRILKYTPGRTKIVKAKGRPVSEYIHAAHEVQLTPEVLRPLLEAPCAHGIS